MKTFFLVVLHVFCGVTEYVLWHKPFNMPVPVLVCAIGLVWLVAIILSVYHAYEIIRWWNAPSPDIQELILEDQRRRQSELQQMLAANPWVDQ